MFKPTAALVFAEIVMRAISRFSSAFGGRKYRFGVHGDHSSGFCRRLPNSAACVRDVVLQEQKSEITPNLINRVKNKEDATLIFIVEIFSILQTWCARPKCLGFHRMGMGTL